MRISTALTICAFGLWLCLLFGQEGKSAPLESLVPRIQAENLKLDILGQYQTRFLESYDNREFSYGAKGKVRSTPAPEYLPPVVTQKPLGCKTLKSCGG